MSFDPTKIFIVLVVALIVLGPEKLPGVMRQGGKYLAELRAVRDRLKAEVDNAFGGVTDVAGTLRTQVNQFTQLSPLRDALGQVRDQVGSISGVPVSSAETQYVSPLASQSQSSQELAEAGSGPYSSGSDFPRTWWDVQGGDDFWEGNPVLN